jgi:hypothetical protein
VVGPPPPSTSPGPGPTLARLLGGAGDEWARAIAGCGDGSVVVVSAVGPVRPDTFDRQWPSLIVDPHDQPGLGIARVGRDGQVGWAHAAAASPAGTTVQVAGASCSPGGESAVALFVENGSIVFGEGAGQGPLSGGIVVTLGDDGTLRRAVSVSGRPTSLAVGDDGGFVLGSVEPAAAPRTVSVRRYAPGGAVAWGEEGAQEYGVPAVALARDGDALVAWRYRLERRGATGTVVWSDALTGNVEAVAETADGTVVASGPFIGDIVYGDSWIDCGGPGVYGFVAWTAPDGTPIHVAERHGPGPVAVAPDGRLGMVEIGGASEVGYAHVASCGPELVRWQGVADEIARRRIASCAGPLQLDGDAWSSAVAATPDGAIWVLGDARRPFDAGTGTLTPDGRDVFLLRFPE